MLGRISLSVLIVFLVLANDRVLTREVTSLYDATKDDIELLDTTSYNAIIFNKSDTRCTFVEHYAHWCGACRRYAQHWRDIAKQTKLWHANVMRVAAINCGDSFNDVTCREQEIHHYPTLKMFPVQANFDAKDHDATIVDTESSDKLINKMISFIEQQAHKPANWPELEPYTSKRFDPLFVQHHDSKYAFLIFENEDSYEGRKIILDFSAYTERLVIRRVVESSNPSLFTKLVINMKNLPAVYLVNNTKPITRPTRFDVEFLRNFIQQEGHKIANEWKNNEKSEDEDNDEENIDVFDDRLNHMGYREKYTKMIRRFIKYANMISETEHKELKEQANAGKEHAKEAKKQELDTFLTNMNNRVYMQDLESSLSVMFRSEISRYQVLDGEHLAALKKWINVLYKYFPGRRPVRNYLREIESKVNSPGVEKLTIGEWLNLVDINRPQTHLPRTVEWRHCKGSEEKYRGYPCSLWTLFHVLTVSQIELEKAKSHPFEENFNVNEVIEAIIGYVKHFFGCEECAENFMKETADYKSYLINPYDAIQYLWRVHNKVNYRLLNDHITEQDPKFPKIQFPSQDQCPKCYLETVDSKRLANHESPWELHEVVLFLTSFYSRFQLAGVDELNRQSSLPSNQIDSNKVAENEKQKENEQENLKETIPVIDAPELKDENVNREDDKIDVDAEHPNEQLNRRKKVLELENEKTFNKISEQKSHDIKLSFILVLFIISSFGFMFIYFGYFKRGRKTKRHII